ncbi:T9SS type A sorting domain-containing protein [Polluticoccus soli]|uniref:T9SS type A sorting domain-containing protein n=1 Tax=Polluticoccus soli TaxID=3034150 RepID=UPI0023E19B8C|nr:T9SS type A sorting domain-containing protein [Flavipsychrobacter sp. JY13-12]
MKHTILISSLLLLLLTVFSASAQTGERGRITGDFSPSATCTVHYSLSPIPVTDNNLVLEISVTSAFELNAHIIDADNKEMIDLETQTVTRRMGKNIDISSLSPGNYYVEFMYGENQETYKVAFSKP